MTVDGDGIGSVDSLQSIPVLFGKEDRPAPRCVDVEVAIVAGGEVGHSGKGIHCACFSRPRDPDEGEDEVTFGSTAAERLLELHEVNRAVLSGGHADQRLPSEP